MKLHFQSKKLEALVTSATKLNREFGAQCAKKVGMRISDLMAVDNFGMLSDLPGKWHPLNGDRDSEWAAEVHSGMRLVVRPVGDLIDPALRHIEYREIKEVLIINIENYH